MLRDVAYQVVEEMGLDYSVTLVSGGESGNYEIVMWDKPRDSYFSLKLAWRPSATLEEMAAVIRSRLQERLVATTPGGDRRPVRRWSAA